MIGKLLGAYLGGSCILPVKSTAETSSVRESYVWRPRGEQSQQREYQSSIICNKYCNKYSEQAEIQTGWSPHAENIGAGRARRGTVFLLRLRYMKISHLALHIALEF